jgi:hypothetical protein
MPPPPSDLAQEFAERVRQAFDAFGPRINHLPIIAEFQDRGASRSAVWRWWGSAQKAYAERAGDPAMFKRKDGKKPKATARAPKAAGPPPVAAGDVAPPLPAIPSVDDVKTVGLLPVLELLRESIQAAQDIMRHGRLDDGKVRNARLIQSGAEHLRRAVETAARLNESVAVQQEMQAFHRIIMQEIGAEAPDLQQRILSRIRRVCDTALADG